MLEKTKVSKLNNILEYIAKARKTVGKVAEFERMIDNIRGKGIAGILSVQGLAGDITRVFSYGTSREDAVAVRGHLDPVARHCTSTVAKRTTWSHRDFNNAPTPGTTTGSASDLNSQTPYNYHTRYCNVSTLDVDKSCRVSHPAVARRSSLTLA